MKFVSERTPEPVIAVLGASGKVGSALANILAEQGYKLFFPNKESLNKDLLEINPNFILNCIGAGTDFNRRQSDDDMWCANYEVPSNLLNLSNSLGANFITIGSILEKIVTFKSSYIESKRAFTNRVVRSHSFLPTSISILTPIVFGLAQEHALLEDIISAAKTRGVVPLESPNAIRDFIHVQDLARVVGSLMEMREFPRPYIEIGSGVGYQLSHLCESVLGDGAGATWKSKFDVNRTNEFSVVANLETTKQILPYRIDHELVQWLKARISMPAEVRK